MLFAKIELWGGLQAIVWYRMLTTVAAVAVLATVTLWRRPVRAGVWVFALAGFGLSVTVQDRSQQLTFLLAPLVGRWAERLWREGRLPPWWFALPLTTLWANFHGGWVILPLALGLAILVRALDHGWRDLAVRRGLLLAVGTVLAGCVSPSGVENVLALRRFSSSTALIVEWQPVALWDWTSVPLLGLMSILVVAWARGRVRPSRGEVVLVLVLVLFAVVAWRNLTPATLMLAPILTGTLARALGESGPTAPNDRPRMFGPAFALGSLGILASIVVASTQSPVVDPHVPQRLLADLRVVSTPQRVVNTYNISGPLLWFGGGPPHVLVGVDGRADRYGADYIDEYQDGMINARPGWEKLFDQLRPTSALLRTDEALSEVLVAQRGWVEVGREGDYVLLRAPTTTGFPQHG